MKPTFNQTVNVLVQAYLNDTLEHGNYCACAVGNLIADAVGAQIVLKREACSCSKYGWDHPDYSGAEWFGRTPTGKIQIKATGYSFDEIWRIEKAFESARRYPNYVGCTDDDIMFNGLMNVIDTLADIHNVDLSVREDAKLLFAKP